MDDLNIQKINNNKHILEYNFGDRNEYKLLLNRLSKYYKKIIVYFYNTNCNPCVIVDEYLETEIKSFKQNTLLLKINRQHYSDVFNLEKVRGTPTLLTYINGEKNNVLVGANLEYIKNNII